MPRIAPIPLVCRCGYRPKVLTSWTNDNPARRFAICSQMEGEGCEFWKWVDPKMCERSTEVIPGLLRKINQLETETTNRNEVINSERRLVAKLEKENEELRIEVKTLRRIIRIVVIVCVSWAIFTFFSRSKGQNGDGSAEVLLGIEGV